MSRECISSTMSRVIKLLDSETMKFLSLYAAERVLYDASLDGYRDRKERMAAAKRISDELRIPGFGPQEVISKFKNLRSSYCQELKKIAESKRSGEDEVYKPKVIWFSLMDSFIRPFVQQRPTKPDMDFPTNTSDEESHPELPPSPCLYQSADDNDATEVISDSVNVTKRKLTSVSPQPLSSKFPKTFHDSRVGFIQDGASSRRFENFSNPAPLSSSEDCYDCFGKYIASMLRTIGAPTSFRLQESITSLVVDAICQTAPFSQQEVDRRRKNY